MLTFRFNYRMTPVIAAKETKPMTWNYRVIMIPAEEDMLFSEDCFVIREVFYNSQDEIEFWSEEDATAMGASFEELCDDYDNMTEAFNKPILLLTEDEDGNPTLVELDDEEDEE
jgi:hypothetical protein